MLIEAIIDLFSEKSINDKTKVLEGLKSDIRDWNVIDAKIESLKEEIDCKFSSLDEKVDKIALATHGTKKTKDSVLLEVLDQLKRINPKND